MESVQASQETQRPPALFPVDIYAIDEHTLEMDLYLQSSQEAVPVLYRAVGVDFTHEDRRRLAEQGVMFLYVPTEQHHAYRAVVTRKLDAVFSDPSIALAERSRTIRTACAKMVEDVMRFPRQPETIDLVSDISRVFSQWLNAENGEFSYLLDMSAHDYYTATHMVNVGIGCGLLGARIAPKDRTFQAELIQGALLHDIGKRHIPDYIINKPGQLEPEEWKQIQRHPVDGYEFLKTNPRVAQAALEMVRDHHERPDGKGYATGLREENLSLAARICSVVDAYEAITSARPYRGPIPPLESLKIMAEGSGTQFDPDVLAMWNMVVRRLLDEDPERTDVVSLPPGELNLEQLTKQPPVAANTALPERGGNGVGGAELRRHKRYKSSALVRVQFVKQGKPYPIPPGTWTTFQLRDISRGGMKVLTLWPLTLNDLLLVELPGNNGDCMRRRARVVRVRQDRHGEWTAGLQFVADA